MAKSNVWMSVSDLMTGLMIIFLFVAVSYMVKVQENNTVLTDYVETKEKLHDKLVNEFAGDTLRWQMAIGRDLTMKFKNPEVLFAVGKDEITPTFQAILDEFLPRYMTILLQDSLRNNILEIRIEGHTDDTWNDPKADAYMENLRLSQKRAARVVEYFRAMPEYQNFSHKDKQQIDYWLTANGMSYGKALDNDGRFVQVSRKPINPDLSRRVEIRIVTSGDEILENFVKKNKKGIFQSTK